jgi:thymidylate synthase
MNVSDIRNLFVEEYKRENFVIDKTGVKTIEIIAAHFIADEEYIFGEPNEEYIQRELKWYLSQSLNVKDLGEVPKIWRKVADPDGFINSNYGWAIFSEENYSQYNNCLNELRNNRDTRRAVMIYNRPSMWLDYNKNGRNDFMCTHAVHFFIRKNKLICYILMRSNDAWAGFRNDKMWHMYVFKKLANDLNVELGEMYWTSGSLHLYENQFYLLDHYIKTGDPCITKEKYNLLYNGK